MAKEMTADAAIRTDDELRNEFVRRYDCTPSALELEFYRKHGRKIGDLHGSSKPRPVETPMPVDPATAQRLDAYFAHAQKRCWQRYNFRPNRQEWEEIGNLVTEFKSENKLAARRQHSTTVRWKNRQFKLAYDFVDRAIVSFLPLVKLKVPAPEFSSLTGYLNGEPPLGAPLTEFTDELGDDDPLSPYPAPLDARRGIVHNTQVNNSSTQPNNRRTAMTASPAPAQVAPRPAAPPSATRPPNGITSSRAQKRKGRLRVLFMAPSGGGKTYSSLLLALGILGDTLWRTWQGEQRARVLVVDTENGSANDYGEDAAGNWPIVPFEVVDLRPPYTVQKYLDAYAYAEAQGFDVIIFDSTTHVWRGEGGLLEEKEKLDARGGNKFSNWGPITEKWNKFRSMILNNRIHLIATVRSKMDYSLDDKGAPKKIGLGGEQRDGFEYDFTLVYELDVKHNAMVTKDRTGMYRDRGIFNVTAETGAELIAWRMSGAPEVEAPAPESAAKPTPRPAAKSEPVSATTTEAATGPTKMTPMQVTQIKEMAEALHVKPAELKAWAGVPTGTVPSYAQADAMIACAQDRLNELNGTKAEEDPFAGVGEGE